jgi:SAM-dependent methyltransferase
MGQMWRWLQSQRPFTSQLRQIYNVFDAGSFARALNRISPMELTYSPDVFSVNNIPQAMQIILTPEGVNTEERWKTETPYVADLIASTIKLTADLIVLDYGCGIGRMAKELIARHGCRVVGIDISPTMRALAVIYVQSERFFACSPTMFDALIERAFCADAAISLWVLQHCHQPADDVRRIRRALKSDGELFVLNNLDRCVPTREHGWVNDQIDIKKLLNEEFLLKMEGKLSVDKSSERISNGTFWGAFRQRSSS